MKEIKLRSGLTLKVYEAKIASGIGFHILHGMDEHIGRYRGLIDKLNENGVTVSGFNYFGHGENIKLGVMETTMIDLITDSIFESHEILKTEFSCNEIVHFGHSLGTYFTRLVVDQIDVKQIILSGSAFIDTKKMAWSKPLVSFVGKFIPRNKTYQWILDMVFNDFNKPFGNKTGFDFITSIPSETSDYIRDPLCSFPISIGFAEMLLELSDRVIKKERQLSPFNAPIVFMSGKEDPIGLMGKEIIQLGDFYKKFSMVNSEVILYEGRHEILHDIDSEKMTLDIINRVLI
ncbi:MAG: alpha/beta hydrolase [Clostridiales bacterium]|nr:alpha/beta hydrolase [Clostridiales bacterium]